MGRLDWIFGISFYFKVLVLTFKIYHYGPQWPWVDNALPVPGKFEAILTGKGEYGPYNIYEMFSGRGSAVSKGSKPFFISETGSTYHLSAVNSTLPAQPGPGRIAIKQTWWREFLNATFLATYPKVKAIGTFEFIKFEELTWRDFTCMGSIDPNMSDPVLDALKKDLSTPEVQSMIEWGQIVTRTNAVVTPTPAAKKNGAVTIGAKTALLGALFALILCQ